MAPTGTECGWHMCAVRHKPTCSVHRSHPWWAPRAAPSTVQRCTISTAPFSPSRLPPNTRKHLQPWSSTTNAPSRYGCPAPQPGPAITPHHTSPLPLRRPHTPPTSTAPPPPAPARHRQTPIVHVCTSPLSITMPALQMHSSLWHTPPPPRHVRLRRFRRRPLPLRRSAQGHQHA